MPSQITITAKTGPASQVTTLILAGITGLNLDLDKRIATVFQGSFPIKEFDLTGVTTFTDSISGANHTFVLS